MSKKRIVVLVLVIVMLSGGIYSHMKYIAPNRLGIKFTEIKSDKIPTSFDDVMVAYVSDIYGYDRNFDAMIASLKSLNPDVLVFGGNLFTQSASEAQQAHYIEAFNELNPPLGKYAVLGENDFRKSYDATKYVLTESKFRFLNNKMFPLTNGTDETIQFVGLDANSDINNRSTEFIYPETHDGFNITVGNNPNYIDFMKDKSVDVYMAGKVMGGYIRLPLIGSLTEESHYIKHDQKVGETHLIVSGGIGLKQPEFRLLSRPDISILILKSSD